MILLRGALCYEPIIESIIMERTRILNQDLFFKSRGYRMNYLAICALLARVYNYMGALDTDYYQKAYDMCSHVINFVIDPSSYSQKN